MVENSKRAKSSWAAIVSAIVAVISGQGSKNGKTNIIIKYNNQSGLPMRDVYFILLPNNDVYP